MYAYMQTVGVSQDLGRYIPSILVLHSWVPCWGFPIPLPLHKAPDTRRTRQPLLVGTSYRMPCCILFLQLTLHIPNPKSLVKEDFLA